MPYPRQGAARRDGTGRQEKMTIVARYPDSTKTSLEQRLRARARERWPQIASLQIRHRGVFSYVDATLADATTLKLCRLRYVGSASQWQFAIYRASHDDYDESVFFTGLPVGTCQDALDTACGLYLNDPTAWTRHPTNLRARPLSDVTAGSTVAVVGDGAVGLCAVRAATRLGANRIVLMGAHPDRLELGRRFGATDVVQARGAEGREAVLGIVPDGAHSVMGCVGTQDSLDTAVAIARPGSHVGLVGVPHTNGQIDIGRIFRHNIGVRAGIAPVQRYLADLLYLVLDGTLDVSPIFTSSVTLADILDGYERMDSRRDIKVLVRI